MCVFEEQDGTWTQADSFANPGSGGGFGTSLAADSGRLLVGAGRSAYIYQELPGGGWSAPVSLPLPAIDPRFGASVVLKDDLAVVAALSTPENPSTAAVYTHRLVDGSWVLNSTQQASDPSIWSYFGADVAVENSRIFVGAPDESPAAVYVCEPTATGAYAQGALLQDSSVTGFGWSMAVTGDRLLVGAPAEGEAGTGTGAVYVFDRVDGSWIRSQKLLAPDATAGDRFGGGVRFVGNYTFNTAAGHRDHASPEEDHGPGSTYVFSLLDPDRIMYTNPQMNAIEILIP